MQLQAGARLGPYEVLDAIGAGGMGEVYRARDPRIGRDVALKILPPSLVANAERMARFEREARAAGALNHPNLVTIFDVGTEQSEPYLVMELLEGRSLRDLLLESPRLTPRLALDVAKQIGEGLAAAHDRGIIHRDLKPENIFVSDDGRVKILDFGLARIGPAVSAKEQAEIATEAVVTAEGKILGTVAYMSPEQIRGQQVDHRSDVFSFGVVLHEMLAGRRPFEGGSAADLMSAILREEPADLVELVPGIAPALARIIRHCLDRNPVRRFQSARDLVFALDAATLPSSTTSGAIPSVPSKSTPWRVVLPFAGLILFVSALTLFLSDWKKARKPALPDKLFRQITFAAGIEAHPSLSPDGRDLVYAARTTRGDFDIFLQRIDGRAAINLTERSGDDDVQPSFSPDGREIAYRSGLTQGGIYVMGATGESGRKVSDFGFNPSWSPDGSMLVVATEPTDLTPETKNSASSLWILDVRTGERRLLLEEDGMQPSWSPDGSRIAYWGVPVEGYARDLLTISATADDPATTIVRLTRDEMLDWNPVWSSDGSHIYFGSDRDGSRNLWRIPVEQSTGQPQGPPEPVTLPHRFAGHFSLARTEEKIVYTAVDRTTEITAAPFDPATGRVGEPASVMRGSLPIHTWAVSPSGDWITLTTGPPRQDLMMIRRDGSETRQLTDDPEIDRGPNFSPDGSMIYFYRTKDGKFDTWRIESDGGGLQQVSSIADRTIWYPLPSPDGSTVAGYNEEGCLVMKVDGSLPVTEARLLPNPGDNLFRCVSWRPDGDGLVGAVAERATGERVPGIVVFDLGSNRYERLHDDAHLISVLRDGRILATTPQETFLMTLAGEKTTTVKPLLDRSVKLSPDGSTLFALRSADEGDIWLVDLSSPGPDPSTK